MGSGKSTAGRKIASLLKWTFADIDRVVEEQNGMTVAELFSSKGEPFFREAETRALVTLSARTRTVVACGGGTPCSGSNMQLMKESGVTVYLKMPVSALVQRLARSGNRRPLLANLGEKELTQKVAELLDKRKIWYEQADITADALNCSPEELTSILADRVRTAGGFL